MGNAIAGADQAMLRPFPFKEDATLASSLHNVGYQLFFVNRERA